MFKNNFRILYVNFYVHATRIIIDELVSIWQEGLLAVKPLMWYLGLIDPEIVDEVNVSF